MQNSNLDKFTLRNVVVINVDYIYIYHLVLYGCNFWRKRCWWLSKPGSDVRIVCIEIESERTEEVRVSERTGESSERASEIRSEKAR